MANRTAPYIPVYVTEDEKDQIRRQAERLGMKMGPYLRFLALHERTTT